MTARLRLSAGDIAAIGFIAVLLILLIVGPMLAPFSPTAFDAAHALEPPDGTFLFGTDEFGRDVFSRVLCGARPTLLLALASAGAGVILGTLTGLIAGYAAGTADEVLMRLMDALMSFPALILAMLVVVMLGANPVNVVLALAVVFWPRSARLVRSAVMELARREFVDAARSRGESRRYILWRELLPNVRMIIVVDFSLRITYGVLLSASLAYLGIGVAPPTPAWGLMVHDGQQFLEIAPWLVIFPCLAVALTAMGTLLAGERLRRSVALPGGGRPR
ncbi:MAG TPA: ABC transporter permease [Acetobacteraceae bacterium]